MTSDKKKGDDELRLVAPVSPASHLGTTKVETPAIERPPAGRVEACLGQISATERPPAARLEADLPSLLHNVLDECPRRDTNQNFDECFPKASSCRGLLGWQTKAR